MKLLNERDGLALGICNGFQALIKLGLVPYGEICGQKEDSPTLTFNTIGRHISKMVYTKVVSNKSPWLQKAQLGGVYCNPASHGEGRFVANDEWLAKLLANGQVATQYVNQTESWISPKNPISTDLPITLRVSQARMDVFLVRWLIASAATMALQSTSMDSRIFRSLSPVLSTSNKTLQIKR